MGTSLCYVTVTLKCLEKIVNIFFLIQYIFYYKKMYVWHFYQKMHTELHSGLRLIQGSIPPLPVKSQHYRVTRNP